MATTQAILIAREDALNEQYDAGSVYLRTRSIDDALTFVEAIRKILLHRPSQATGGGSGGESVAYDVKTLYALMRDAERFIGRARAAQSQYRQLRTPRYFG